MGPPWPTSKLMAIVRVSHTNVRVHVQPLRDLRLGACEADDVNVVGPIGAGMVVSSIVTPIEEIGLGGNSIASFWPENRPKKLA